MNYSFVAFFISMCCLLWMLRDIFFISLCTGHVLVRFKSFAARALHYSSIWEYFTKQVSKYTTVRWVKCIVVMKIRYFSVLSTCSSKTCMNVSMCIRSLYLIIGLQIWHIFYDKINQRIWFIDCADSIRVRPKLNGILLSIRSLSLLINYHI